MALTADDTGVSVNYPIAEPMSDVELGSLASIIRDLIWQTGVDVSAHRIVYSLD
jgi:hypothetical protein